MKVRTCIVCGCTDDFGCASGCQWTHKFGKDRGLCSACPAPAQRAAQQAPADAGGGAKRRIMIALAQNPDGLVGRRLAILSDVKQGGSTWRGAMAGLRKDAHVDDAGDLFKLTPSGLQALGEYVPLPTGADLREYWQQKIGSGTRGRIFTAILAAGGQPVPADQVAIAADVELGGSTWRGHMAHLRGLELVSGSNELTPSPELFE